MLLWIVLGIIIALAIMGTYVVMKKRRASPDYRSIFSLGILFVFMYFLEILTRYLFTNDYEISSIFLIMGGIYIAIGLVNKDKWLKVKKRR